MNAKRMLRPLFASAIVALLAARPTAATAAAWSVDLSAPKGGILAAPNVESEPGSEADRRTADGLVRRVVLDRSCVSGLGGAFAPGDTISVSFFDGDVRTLRIEEQFPSLFSRRVFSVSEQGALLPRSGTITVGDDGFTMHLDDAETGHVFRVFDGPDGGIVVEETDPGAGIVEESEPIVPDLGPEDGPAGGEGEEGPEAKAIVQGDTIIDYMVVFDASGAAYANTQGGIQAVAEEVVSKMNTALVNSDLYSSYRFRLVDVMTVSDNYTNINSSTYGINSSNLSATRTHSEITARRNANCADMWTTLIDTGSAYGTTGLGWSLSSLSRASSFGSYACNICSIRAVLNSHTLTHETGHNMGAGHSNASGASSPGPQMSDMPYSSGYHFKAANGTYYHTIMAYNSLTNQHYQPTACFSSPLLTAGGSPCGTADANDNRRVLLQTYSYAAAWKTSLHPVTYDVFLDKADGSLFDGTLTVTIECGSPTEPVYYTLDGTTPTASSSHYTGPIAITKTTTLKAVCISGGNAGDVASATYYSIPEVLGVTGVSWTMSGDADWRWDASQSAARSGKIGHSQSTTLTASLEGPGTLTFSWKADSERNWDYLTRTVSWETATSQISGTGLSWATVEVAVPSGRQTVSWTYSKDGSGSSGEDCGWVKGFVWTPDSSAPGGTVAAGTPSFTSCHVTATVTKTGEGATSVAVVFEYSKNASFSPKQTVSAGSVSGTGTKSATLSSLDPGTTYYVRAVLTGSPTGASATTDAKSFTTAAYTAPTLGTVSASATTTSLTLSVPVAALGAVATSELARVGERNRVAHFRRRSRRRRDVERAVRRRVVALRLASCARHARGRGTALHRIRAERRRRIRHDRRHVRARPLRHAAGRARRRALGPLLRSRRLPGVERDAVGRALRRGAVRLRDRMGRHVRLPGLAREGALRRRRNRPLRVRLRMDRALDPAALRGGRGFRRRRFPRRLQGDLRGRFRGARALDARGRRARPAFLRQGRIEQPHLRDHDQERR